MKVLVNCQQVTTTIKASILGLCFLLTCMEGATAQAQKAATTNNMNTEQEVINISKQKWQWMADKNVDKLASLFHDESKFVHMSGTWKKTEELDIIKTGSIWYKQADVHDTAVELFEDTAILWSRITLVAVVRGSDAKTEFTVTEVFKKEGNAWKILALTFSSVRDTHTIKH